MADSKCAFCDIARGAVPAVVVWENERFLAFLDHRPLFHGHVLLVPKEHLRLLSDLPAALAGEFLTAAQRLEQAVETGLSAAGSMILVNNVVSQSVPHLHLHVIPRNFKDGLRLWLGPRHPYESADQAEEYAARIRAALALGSCGLATFRRGVCRGCASVPRARGHVPAGRGRLHRARTAPRRICIPDGGIMGHDR